MKYMIRDTMSMKPSPQNSMYFLKPNNKFLKIYNTTFYVLSGLNVIRMDNKQHITAVLIVVKNQKLPKL